MYMYMCVLCMVSMCCVWCPCVVTAVLSSLFIFWSYFTRVVFHTSWHMMHTTWPMHNIIIYPPFGHFSTTFDLVQWLAASHNHIPTQNSTIFTHIEWETVHWQRPIDGPPPTPCDTPTVRKALLGLKSHCRWISTKTKFHCHGAADRKYLKTHAFAGISSNMHTVMSNFLWPHIYTCTCSMLEVPRPHTCTNAGTFPKVQVHFILSLPSSMSKLIRRSPGLHVDMYYRVIPSQIIMLNATMSSDVEHFCYELVEQ